MDIEITRTGGSRLRSDLRLFSVRGYPSEPRICNRTVNREFLLRVAGARKIGTCSERPGESEQRHRLMSRTLALCGLGIATGNEVCCELPAYRIEARTYDGKRVILYLCSDHIHRAWQLAQMLMDKRHPGENRKVRSIHLHQLQKASAAAEAAS